VSATIMAAVDHRLRVIPVRDSVCSTSDEGHDELPHSTVKLVREPVRGSAMG
jgi:hypothetical protein